MKAVIFSHLYTRGQGVFCSSEVEFIICSKRDESEFLSLQQKHQARVVVLDSRPYSLDFFKQLLPQTLIVRFGTGVDNIPLDICRQYGHHLANTPGASITSVSDYVFITMAILSQGIWLGSQSLIKNEWVRTTGHSLSKKKLAVLGLGSIGLAVAQAALTRHDMEVIGLCRKNQIADKKKEIEKNNHISFLLTDNLQQTISQADFITLHLSLNQDNEYLINQETLSYCKPNAFIINTARGKLIREIDLRHALNRGEIAGAALDVFEKEPYLTTKTNSTGSLRENNEPPNLISFPNVILTPHIAGHTEEANLNIATMTLENIKAFYQERWKDMYLITYNS